MGLTQTHAVSREAKFFAKVEGTAGTHEKLAATDAAKVIKATIAETREDSVREDSRATRSQLETIRGRAVVAWDVEAEVIPSGTAGTPPDLHPLYQAAMGTYANTPSTSDAYTLANSQTLDTVSLMQVVSGIMGQSAWGGWVDEMTLSIQGGETPKIKFAGGAMGYTLTGTSTLNGAMSASTTMIVQTADQHNFEINSLVQIGSTANVLVSADTSRPTFTVDTAVTEDDAAAVIPYAPTETTAGSPIAGVSGSWTYDSATVYPTGLEISMRNNIRAIDDEALEQYVQDVVPGYREVTGTLTLRARKDWLVHMTARRAFSTQALTVVVGATAGSILTISVPYAELEWNAIDVPAGDGDVVFSIPFRALGSSGEDELALTFT